MILDLTLNPYAEWSNDVKKDGYDLAAALIVNILKTILVAAIAVLVVAAVVSILLVSAGLTVPVILVALGTIAIGSFLGYSTDVADKYYGKKISGNEQEDDGLAAVLAPWLRQVKTNIEGSWTMLRSKFPRDYMGLEF